MKFKDHLCDSLWLRMSGHKRGRMSVVLTVDHIAVFLKPGECIQLATKVNVGHEIDMAIAFFDKNGNPMLTNPTPDTPPAWSNGAPTVDPMTVSKDGLSAVAQASAAGTDDIHLTVVVNGVSFSADLAVEVDAAPQELGSVQIVPTVK